MGGSRTIDATRTRRRVVVLLLLCAAAIVAGSVAAGADPPDSLNGEACDNGGNAGNCEVPHTTVPVVLPYLDGPVHIGPVNADGSASCRDEDDDRDCGFAGIGPVAIGGDADCYADYLGCGFYGTGPIAIGGNASCQARTWGCGTYGTGPIAVGGNASCSNGRCGDHGTSAIAVGGDAACLNCNSFGIGPTAVGGDATCEGSCGSRGTSGVAVGGTASCEGVCGFAGTGPIGTHGVSCTGTCGKGFTLLGVPLLRIGTPGITALGEASCSREFDASQATSFTHLQNLECMSVAEIAGL